MKTHTPSLIAIALALGLASAASAQTLLVRYDFDEGTGTTAADSGTGVASNGTFGGNATWSSNTPDGSGSSLSLAKNATDANHVTASSAEVNSLSSFTITLWINAQGTITAGDRLVSTLSSGTFKGFDLNLQALTSTATDISASGFRLGLLVDGTSGGSALFSSAGTSINANNQWVFVAVSYDGTKTSDNVTFYTGAVSSAVGQLGIVGTLNMGAVDGTTGSLQIGNTSATTGDRTPSSLFDDVRIYSGVATSSFLNDVRLQNLSNIPEPSTWGALAGALSASLAITARRRRLI